MQTNVMKYAPKRLAWGAAAMAILFSQITIAQQKIDQTLDTTSSPVVEMEHVQGKADIKTWDKNQVRITGTLGSLTEEFTFEKRGNTVVIDVEVKDNHYRWEDKEEAKDDLTVYVPAGSKLAYETLNSDVKVDGLQGGTSIEVVNGDIEGVNLAGRVNVESVNGNVELRNITGALTVESVNGDIDAEHNSDAALAIESVNGKITLQSNSSDVSIETVNGNTNVVLGTVNRLAMASVNGDANVSLALNSGADVGVETVGGSITLSFTNDVSARFDIEAHAGGKIVNKLNGTDVNKAKYGPGQWLEFTEGSGDARVRISTVNGRITVE
ncbi:DUF4097 family beta strand repeat-containing protein [Alteromonas gilva]|uniref:Adhesin domain-containing protein n=1 Tax=Alteromonas gilva TaxID=2987522 RepID=A0ABT5KYJ7_9ALTE|nr:hypothetical protein [Alteromonas gilva]MDC8829842.1 hypothetical protein [Alteromonas gilva]